MNMKELESRDFHPIRLTWSHGELISENAEQFTCRVLAKKKTPNKIESVVVENKNNIHVGKLDQSPLSNNYLVIRNRRNNTLRWYKTDNFLMMPNRPELEKKKPMITEENESRRDAISNLNKTMGSKKIKRQVMETEKINVSIDNIEESLKTAIENKELVIEKTESISLLNENHPYLPPCNRNASTVEQVYKVYDLIPPEVMTSLDQIAEEILHADILKLSMDKRLTEFFMKAYPFVHKPETTKIKLLLFADILMQFLKAPARNVKLKNLIICKYSNSLNQKILSDFCTIGLDGNRTRPSSMRDKAFCYILICLFLASNFVVDISVLAGLITSVDYSRLPTLIKAIGATKERDSATCFRLKLPLAQLSDIKGRRKSTNFGKKR